MIFNFMRKSTRSIPNSLSELEEGGRGVVGDFDLPEQVAEQLMNLGMVPGLEVTVAQSGPGGDPRVYRVDGTEIALRGDLSRCIKVLPLEVQQQSVETADCAGDCATVIGSVPGVAAPLSVLAMSESRLELAAKKDHAGQTVAKETLQASGSGPDIILRPDAVEGQA
jgi:Fe2+ transport system protein FeoA